ncbi:hypothetical protein D3C72_1183920 [compost metagenome]
MFSHVSCGTTIFAAKRQTLQHAQRDQDDRSGNADLRCAGQHADEEGRDAHDEDRDQKGIFAADDIAQTPEYQRAEGAHEEAGGKSQKREDVTCRFRILAEEVRADIDRERAVQIKIVPFEDCSERRGENHLLLFTRHRTGCAAYGCNICHCLSSTDVPIGALRSPSLSSGQTLRLQCA